MSASETKDGSKVPLKVPAGAERAARRVLNFAAPTVWHEFTPLAAETKAINLGQGFPGWASPDFLKDAACAAIRADHNQYARSAGHPALTEALAKKYSAAFGREVNAMTDVVITAGVTEALFGTMCGLCNPGDEVVTFEPSFDIYHAQVDMFEGKLVSVPLRHKKVADGDDYFGFDFDELERAVNSKTRMLLLNSPHNPTGKVFSRKELEQIAALVKKFPDVIVLADEVYEQLTFDGVEHISFASLPGMWERTITMASAGKTFSVTGWKIGWAVGPAPLVRPIAITHQWVMFSLTTPLQVAVATALERASQPYEGFPSYYDWLRDQYRRKRKILLDGLTAAGLKPVVPHGTFFIMADTSDVQVPQKYLDDKSVPRDWALCRWLTREIGVAAIPPSAFHQPETKELAAHLIRLAFCKEDAELEEASKRLLKVKDFLKKK